MPLVDMFSHINALKPWNPNHEIMSGLVHVNLPDFDRQTFREAMANAFCDPLSPLSNMALSGKLDEVGESDRWIWERLGRIWERLGCWTGSSQQPRRLIKT